MPSCCSLTKRAIIGSINLAPGSFDSRRELAIEVDDEAHHPPHQRPFTLTGRTPILWTFPTKRSSPTSRTKILAWKKILQSIPASRDRGTIA